MPSPRKSASNRCPVGNNFDPTIVNGEFVADTWGDGIDKLPYPPAVREAFKKFRKELLAIDLEKRKVELANIALTDLMKDYPPEIKLWWDGFGASSWGSRSEDSPAAIGVAEMQWMAGPNRKDDRYTWPGGLGALSKHLVDILQPKNNERMQTGATIVAVTTEKNAVNVTYLQGTELKTVAAKAVIMATPKFITRRVVEGIPEKQDEAMQQMRYIPYALVNLIFDKEVYRKGYDNWCPGCFLTDFIVADWVVRKQPEYHPEIQHPELLHAAARGATTALADRANRSQTRGGRSEGFPETSACHERGSDRGPSLPARASHVHDDARPVHEGATAAARARGSDIFREHGCRRSGFEYHAGNHGGPARSERSGTKTGRWTHASPS